MKQMYIALMCLLVLFGMSNEVHAEDVFPEFSTTLTTVHIPIDILKGYHEDPSHEVGVYVAYNVDGQFFADVALGHIQTLVEGFSGTSDRSTPWKTLTELLAAYQTTDMEALRSLYTPESQDDLDDLVSDPDLKERFMDFMSAIAGMDIWLGFDYKGGFLAIVNIHYHDAQTDLMPYYFVQSGSTYLLSSVVLDEALDANITVFLQQDHTVEDLLAPPDPQHTLTVEKGGTGDGTVVGSGIDCGSDCVEIYREGTLIYLKAAPYTGSTFDKWLVDSAPIQHKIVMNKDMTVTALFTSIGTPPPLEESGSIAGRVTDIAGNPIANQIVQVQSQCGGTEYGSTPTEADGTYFISSLPAGVYYVNTYPNLHYPMEWWNGNEGTTDCNEAAPVTVTFGETTSDINFSLE